VGTKGIEGSFQGADARQIRGRWASWALKTREVCGYLGSVGALGYRRDGMDRRELWYH